MKKELIFTVIIALGITVFLFYKTFFSGMVPFPADALVSDFQPWRSTSYLGYNPGSIPNKAQYPDTLRQLYPWRIEAVRQLKENTLPLWNPYNFSGTPLLANFQSAALYPFNILFFVLPDMYAWTVLVILQPLLSLICMYLYMRSIKINRYGAWLASSSYATGGFMSVWLEYNTVGHVILWLPLLLLAVEKLRTSQSLAWLSAIAFVTSVSLLAGHPQVWAYMMLFAGAYGFMRLKGRIRLLAGGFTVLGVGMCGIQIIPGAELIFHAARSPHDPSHLFDSILIQPWQLINLSFPNFFGNPATRTYWLSDTFVGKVTTIGLVPLFFLLSAFRRRSSITKWFVAAASIVLLLITNNPVTQLLYRLPIPVLTSSSPTLMSFLFAFSLSVLCGMGLDYWMTDRHSVKKLLLRTIQVFGGIGVLYVLTILPVIPLLTQNAQVIRRTLLYAGGVAGATLFLFGIAITKKRLLKAAIGALLILHILDLSVFFRRFNPFSHPSLVFPGHDIISYLSEKSPDRYWGYGTAHIDANFATYFGIYSPEGYDPLYPKWYGEFLYSFKTGKLLTGFNNTTRSDAAISSHFGDGGLTDLNKQHVLNTLSVKYILDRTENGGDASIFPPKIFTKIYENDDWIIYENTHAMPRAYLDTGTASIVSYTPQSITIRTQSTMGANLIVSDTYYPGWTARIDGLPAQIKKSEHTLREVAVPKGKHTVLMQYEPVSARIGWLVSVLSTATGAVWLYILKKRHEA